MTVLETQKLMKKIPFIIILFVISPKLHSELGLSRHWIEP
jgi:hypothetical protein